MYDKYIEKIYNLLKHKNHSNIIISGNIDIDKLDIINNALKKRYNISKNIYITSNNVNYIKNNIYFLFDINKIYYNNKLDWLNIIKNIIENDNYYLDNNKYIIFNNYNKISINTQNIFKVLFEKHVHIKFIVITDKYNNVINPIQSRFINIRIPLINNINKWNEIDKLNIDFNNFYNNKNLNLEYFKLIKYINCDNYNDIIYNLCKYIFILINKDDNKNIKELKELSYIIISSCIPFKNILIQLIYFISNNDDINNEKKYKLVKLITEVEYNISKSYLKLIHIENLFFNILYIIKIN